MALNWGVSERKEGRLKADDSGTSRNTFFSGFCPPVGVWDR